MKARLLFRANNAGAGNGAEALSFHVGHPGRAAPDLRRSAGERVIPAKKHLGRNMGAERYSGVIFLPPFFCQSWGLTRGESWA